MTLVTLLKVYKCFCLHVCICLEHVAHVKINLHTTHVFPTVNLCLLCCVQCISICRICLYVVYNVFLYVVYVFMSVCTYMLHFCHKS